MKFGVEVLHRHARDSAQNILYAPIVVNMASVRNFGPYMANVT
jgi:hypothetical protein